MLDDCESAFGGDRTSPAILCPDPPSPGLFLAVEAVNVLKIDEGVLLGGDERGADKNFLLSGDGERTKWPEGDARDGGDELYKGALGDGDRGEGTR